MGVFLIFLEVPQGGGAGYHHFMHYKIRVPWVPPDSRRGMYKLRRNLGLPDIQSFGFEAETSCRLRKKATSELSDACCRRTPRAWSKSTKMADTWEGIGLKVEQVALGAQLWLPWVLREVQSEHDRPTCAIARGVAIISGAWGDGPLTYAAVHGHLEVVEALLAAGASVEAKNHNGRGPQRRDGCDRTDVVGRRCNRRHERNATRHWVCCSFGIFSVLCVIPCWEVNYQ